MNLIGFVMNPAASYLDPAATSILLTSITGVVIAVSATAVILWRKAKKKVAKALHIDENANKEVEEEIVVTEVEENEEK